MKKLILVATVLLNIGCICAQGQYSQSPPILLQDTVDSKYMLWQIQFCPVSATRITTVDGSLDLNSGHLSSTPTPSAFVSADGFRIQALRVLDTFNYGNSLKNTIFPLPVFHLANGDDNGFVISDSTLYLGKVDIDSTAKVKIVLRNAGNSKLSFPSGFVYNKATRTLNSTENMDSIVILRNDNIWNKEIKWQIRQNKEQPNGEPLKYAERKYDALETSINPGDTTQFYIDVRPTIVGLKRDSLFFKYGDGLQNDSVLIPMSVLSTWTLNYEITNSRARPSTPSLTNEFIDTIFIFNNKENRTRITSMRLGINFNPRNVMIKEFVIDTSVFPKGWTWEQGDIDSTEKYGKLFFTAQADTNQLIKLTNPIQPDQLSYFTAGTDEKVILGYFKGIQLLGTSDTTHFIIDTSYSQHNYSQDYVFPKDSDNVLYKLPYINSLSGIHISDSLLFQSKLLLNSKEPSAIIENVFPNPAGQNGNDLQVVVKVLKKNTNLKIKILDILNGKSLIESKDEVYDIGLNTIPFKIDNLISGTNIIVMTTESNTDIWLINIVK